uniref:Uncharacterized protein n=1 Tax=Arundo donax TaxID=35708 RepID=A0A0A9I1N0_ARUDO
MYVFSAQRRAISIICIYMTYPYTTWQNCVYSIDRR